MNFQSLLMSVMSCSVLKLFRSVFVFLCGFVIGNLIASDKTFKSYALSVQGNFFFESKYKSISHDGLFDETLSADLFQEVKILCWVFTHPDNHETKAIHVKNLWGKRCNKLLFMSVEEDPVLGTIALPIGTGMEQLWNKTIKTFQYVRLDNYR